MEGWKWTTIVLCGFGLLKELRPSEPFVTEYILDFKNVTSDTLIHSIFPISTYTILATLVIIFLVTDFLRYRPVIIFQSLCYIGTYATLIYGESVLSLKIVQILYGFAISADVAYYTYIYAQVRRENYKKVTSYTYSAAFVGKFLAGTLSQILVSTKLMDYHQLNYITLTSVACAFALSLSLPQVKRSMYFHSLDTKPINESVKYDCDNNFSPEIELSSPINSTQRQMNVIERTKLAYPLLWKDFKAAYTNSYILKWSIWWAIATAGNLQVQSYIQALWKVVDNSTGSRMYNGAVNGIQCFLCAVLSFAVGHTQIHWNKWGESMLSVISVCQGLVLVLMSQTDSLFIAYASYLTFRVLYQVLITIANAEVAQGISKDSCGLIFGVNTFLALVLQTILTIAVADENGLALNERTQFIVYAGCFGVMGIVFAIIAISTFCRFGCSHSSESSGKKEVEEETTQEIQNLRGDRDEDEKLGTEQNPAI